MNSFTWLFVAALATSILLRLWLANRHVAHIRKHRGSVPESFAERVTHEEHSKAADYTITNTHIGMLGKKDSH